MKMIVIFSFVLMVAISASGCGGSKVLRKPETRLVTPSLATSIEIGAYFRDHAQTPTDYILSKATSHTITIIGEAHWIEQDVSFVNSLIPALYKSNIDLAMEVFPASEQSRIDTLIRMPEWSDSEANAIMRAAAWPYREYRDILHSAWSANRGSDHQINVLALGPPADWRSTLLPQGRTYDSFMADLVTEHVAKSDRKIIAYTGMHHAFTRYYQAELDNLGRARQFMDRMGNMLMRRFGEQVFVVALHKPMWCGSPAEPSYCLPFAGRIDCAAFQYGRPLAFDVVASPLEALRFEPENYYGYAHTALRFADYTDGYIWQVPVKSFRPVSIIALSEYAPDESSIAQVMRSDPFTGRSHARASSLEQLWAEQIEANHDFLTNRRWKHLADATCGGQKTDPIP